MSKTLLALSSARELLAALAMADSSDVSVWFSKNQVDNHYISRSLNSNLKMEISPNSGYEKVISSRAVAHLFSNPQILQTSLSSAPILSHAEDELPFSKEKALEHLRRFNNIKRMDGTVVVISPLGDVDEARIYSEVIKREVPKGADITLVTTLDTELNLEESIAHYLADHYSVKLLPRFFNNYPLESILFNQQDILCLSSIVIPLHHILGSKVRYAQSVADVMCTFASSEQIPAIINHDKAIRVGLELPNDGIYLSSDREHLGVIDLKNCVAPPGDILLNAAQPFVKLVGEERTSIIIPTHNRPDYLERSINYMRHSPFSVIYCDSTESPYKSELPAHIKYLHLPGETFVSKVLKGLSSTSTKYVILCPDDDYIMFDALIEGVSFLNQNPNFSFCVGDYVGFKDNFDNSFDSIYERFPKEELIGQPLEKISEFFRNYYQVLWALHTKTSLEKSFTLLEKMKVKNDNFIELVIGGVACFSGDLKFQRGLWGARELTTKPHWGTQQENVHLIKKRPSIQEDYTRFERELDLGTTDGLAKAVFDSFMEKCRRIYPKEDFDEQ
jgi:glycosyltransferase domain-containing protein